MTAARIVTRANPPLIARVIAAKRALGLHRGLPDVPRAHVEKESARG